MCSLKLRINAHVYIQNEYIHSVYRKSNFSWFIMQLEIVPGMDHNLIDLGKKELLHWLVLAIK